VQLISPKGGGIRTCVLPSSRSSWRPHFRLEGVSTTSKQSPLSPCPLRLLSDLEQMMVLTAAQHSQIAAAYERAAGDETLPLQARSAFAKKASWFRMLAQIRAAKHPQQTARPLALC
jgi:hypothetical protein